MLIFKDFISLALTSLVIISVHAGHNRIIIKVPQRTRHIYHHHVKKVPVYVILPETKPKIISDLDDLMKPRPKNTPCKDNKELAIDFKEYSPQNRYARYSQQEKDSYHPDWLPDRDNNGAFIPTDGHRDSDRDFQPPLFGAEEHLYDYNGKSQKLKSLKKQVKRKTVPPMKYQNSYDSEIAYNVNSPQHAATEPQYSGEHHSSFDYPSNVEENFRSPSQNSYSSSYQYQINHRIDEIPATITEW